ncbi:sodium/hydrogen exchanger [Sulfuricella denitrificans skB26]|uniref:Sodium/hydrogen exchanger n=1 Tax=Sulfuricella denitrificans (strain DSM 22764 / NBRC 105220 / skB26) TaxID=1163617 RepID=S6AB49_SULDS|nr:sodium:proton antiporter [Sulfuricella denitrificans]BAN34318.1 sodium/hydrogen exchanger [Sulfuricella denitrificans skB26]
MTDLAIHFSGFFIIVTALGIGAQWLAWRFRLPAILLLAIAGLAAGPGLGLIRPSEQLGAMLNPLVGLMVSIILFEGGMNLRFHELREAGPGVRRLGTAGVAITFFLGSIAAYYVGGLSWPVAMLFGAIIVVTGPTVIMPLLRQARLKQRPASLLKWEGIINDPTGALLAVLVFEYFLYFGSDAAILQVLSGLAAALTAAITLGVGGGYLLGKAFSRDDVPEFLKAPVTLAFVLLCYGLANLAQHEAGLLATTLLGMTIGNMQLRSIEELRRLKEYVSILLVSGIFVILTANLDPHILTRLDWRSGVLLALVVFAIRPVSVLLSTVGLGMNWRERVLLAWIAPRGVVAVTVAGVFAASADAQGYAGADLLLPLIVSLVLLTVILHGSTIGWLARRLGLASANQNGILIVGASNWSTDLAIQLKEMNISVLIADSRWHNLNEARLSGIRTHYGEILSEHAEMALELNDMGFLLATTANDAYNALVCSRFAPEFGSNQVFQLPMHDTAEAQEKKSIKLAHRGVIALRPMATKEELERRNYRNWKFKKTHFTQTYSYENHLQIEPEEALPTLMLRPDGTVLFYSEQFPLKPVDGDILLSYVPPVQEKAAKPSEQAQ